MFALLRVPEVVDLRRTLPQGPGDGLGPVSKGLEARLSRVVGVASASGDPAVWTRELGAGVDHGGVGDDVSDVLGRDVEWVVRIHGELAGPEAQEPLPSLRRYEPFFGSERVVPQRGHHVFAVEGLDAGLVQAEGLIS